MSGVRGNRPGNLGHCLRVQILLLTHVCLQDTVPSSDWSLPGEVESCSQVGVTWASPVALRPGRDAQVLAGPEPSILASVALAV